VCGGISDIRVNNGIGFNLKPLIIVSAAKSAFVVGAPNSDLQENAGGLRWRPNNIAFVVHFNYLESFS
jgi:hypothetical protein